MKTLKIRRKQSGFTLVEVLIVVIILAILAAVLVPKLLSQPENAVIAEANNMLGTMARAQTNYMALNQAADGAPVNTGVAISTACGGGIACVASEWAAIGMDTPGNRTKFKYGCTTTTCTATRRSGSPVADDASRTITFTYTKDNYTFTACGGNYTAVGGTLGDAGCRNK